MSKIIEVVFPDSAPDEVLEWTIDWINREFNGAEPPEPIIVRLQEG